MGRAEYYRKKQEGKTASDALASTGSAVMSWIPFTSAFSWIPTLAQEIHVKPLFNLNNNQWSGKTIGSSSTLGSTSNLVEIGDKFRAKSINNAGTNTYLGGIEQSGGSQVQDWNKLWKLNADVAGLAAGAYNAISGALSKTGEVGVDAAKNTPKNDNGGFLANLFKKKTDITPVVEASGEGLKNVPIKSLETTPNLSLKDLSSVNLPQAEMPTIPSSKLSENIDKWKELFTEYSAIPKSSMNETNFKGWLKETNKIKQLGKDAEEIYEEFMNYNSESNDEDKRNKLLKEAYDRTSQGIMQNLNMNIGR